MDVVNSMKEGGSADEPAACLDGKFWVWESLEEALRPEVLTMSQDDFYTCWEVFARGGFNKIPVQWVYMKD